LEVVIERDATPSVAPERRVKPRCKLALALTLHGGHNFYLGVSENLSEGGLFVVTYMKLEIGEIVEVEFTLPTLDRPCRVVGEVRWARTADCNRAEHNNYGTVDDEHHRPGYGIQFKAVRNEDQNAIEQFLATRQPDFYEA
jgi:uncharacterized protein (TIGR02266 family)